MTPNSAAVTQRLAALAISETGFVFDPRTGHSYTANATALAALAALQKGLTIGAVAARVREQFACDGAEVEEDLEEFLRTLHDHRLIPDPAGLRRDES